MKKGFLISFEGGEGCGKSTQIKKFTQYLKEQGVDFLLTREPGGTELGEEIRNILLNYKGDISPLTEFFLFCVSRSKLINEVVKPALEEGKVVVMDRYFDSSIAYQGYAGGVDINKIIQTTKFVTDGVEPDLTFLLDLKTEVGMQRKQKDENLKNFDRIERKSLSFHEKVHDGYLEIAKKFPNRIVVIDASQSPDEVFNNIKEIYQKRIKR